MAANVRARQSVLEQDQTLQSLQMVDPVKRDECLMGKHEENKSLITQCARQSNEHNQFLSLLQFHSLVAVLYQLYATDQ